ncbi:MAG TPA: DNA replication and repair protein RecF, partial [Rudaea sp.]
RGSVRLGLSRTGARWSARIDNETPQGLVALLRECAVVCFEPGSHSLISGPSEERRSYLDWGVFHVEPRYPEWSRRYRRALQQRNALLKTDPDPAELASWTQELVAAAEPIAIARAAYFSALQPKLRILSAELIPELGDPIFRCRQGWDEGMPLGTAVERSLDLDRLRKYTARGPHRADWSIQFQHAPAREQLSRGQEKLCAIVCMLAQAQLFRDARGEWPIVLLDDLASELDIAHQNAVLRMLLAQDAQVLMTGTEIPAGLRDTPAPIRRFHVEQGQVQPLV